MKNLFKRAILIATFCCPAVIAHAEETHEPIGSDIKNVPIFDAHIHYKEPAWGPYPPEAVIKLMDKTGVAMALVSSTPDQGTIKLWKYAPNRIVPELRPYKQGAGSSDWMKAEGMIDYLNQRLDSYPHEGLGEFHVHYIDPDDIPMLRAVAKMAVERDIPIHVHSGAAPVEMFFEFEPDLTVIWAHAGMSEPARVVMRMMNKYPKMYADTSYREAEIYQNGKITKAWRKIIEKHYLRLMVGSDTWVNDQWDDYEYLIGLNREWLSHFPREIAEPIAYKNAEQLFDRTITMDQIGTR